MLANEISKILLDNKWHSTTQISILIRIKGKGVIRPEIAWRRANRVARPHETIDQGYRLIVFDVLRQWHKLGKIEKNYINRHIEWKTIDMKWLKGVANGTQT